MLKGDEKMKVMMFAHNGSLNRGCEAIVRSSVKLIKETIDEASVCLISGRPETDRMISSLDEIHIGSSKSITKYSYDWFIASFTNKFLKDESYALSRIYNNVIKHIKDADVCLSIGGDNYCYGEQPWLYEIDKRVKAEKKKLVLWACSIGEEDISERKLEDLRSFDLILARESVTYNMLKFKGLKNIELCADPAFTMDKEELELPLGWQDKNTIGLNFSPLVCSKNKESQSTVKKLIEHILITTNMTIALTPHVIEDNNNDYELLYEYYKEFKSTNRVIILPNNLSAVQYKGYIARMRFFIGARTHATIAAYSSHVPTMVLGYSVKSRGIAMDIFGEEKLVLSLNDISDENKLKDKFDEMIQGEDDIKEKLFIAIPNIKKLSYKSVEYLSKLL